MCTGNISHACVMANDIFKDLKTSLLDKTWSNPLLGWRLNVTLNVVYSQTLVIGSKYSSSPGKSIHASWWDYRIALWRRIEEMRVLLPAYDETQFMMLDKGCDGQLFWHIEAETKRSPIRRRYFQVGFLEWKILNAEWNLTEICSLGSNWPLSAPMVASWPTHICVPRPHWVKSSSKHGCVCAGRESRVWSLDI